MWTEQQVDGVRIIAEETETASWTSRRRRFADLFAHIRATPDARWVADLHTVRDLTSQEVAELVTVGQELARRGGRLAIAAPTPAVSLILRSARTEKLLPSFPDIAAATTALADGHGAPPAA